MAPEMLTWPLPTRAAGHSTLGNTVAKMSGAEVPVHAYLCPCKTRTLRWQKEITQPLPGHCPSTQEKYLGGQNASLSHSERSLSQLSGTNPRT